MSARIGEIRFPAGGNIMPFAIKQSKLVCKLIKQTKLNPTAKRIHDLRVAIRRLRVVLWLVRLDKEMPRFRKLSGGLRSLGKVLGGLRQLDVAIEDAKSYRLPVYALKVQRNEARNAVAKALTRKMSGLLNKQGKRLARILPERGGAGVKDGALNLLGRAKAFKGRVPGRKVEFHQFRIFIKKARYTIEAFGSPADPIKVLHDRLGKAHDLEVLQHLTGENDAVKRDEAEYRKMAAKAAKPVMRFVCESLQAAASEGQSVKPAGKKKRNFANPTA